MSVNRDELDRLVVEEAKAKTVIELLVYITHKYGPNL
jgi:hypothetical protein